MIPVPIISRDKLYADSDGDGYGDASNSVTSCTAPSNTVLDATDCDDTNFNNFPGQIWYTDSDSDGSGDPNNSVTSCAP